MTLRMSTIGDSSAAAGACKSPSSQRQRISETRLVKADDVKINTVMTLRLHHSCRDSRFPMQDEVAHSAQSRRVPLYWRERIERANVTVWGPGRVSSSGGNVHD